MAPVQSSPPSSRPNRAEPLRPQGSQPRAEQAEQFSRTLKRQENAKPKQAAKPRLEKAGDDIPPGAAIAIEPLEPAMPHMGKSAPKTEKAGDAGASGIPAGTASSVTGDPQIVHDRAPFAGAQTEFAMQFAERLALPDGGFARSRLELDDRFYTVSDVVIENRGEDALSISYGSQHSQADDGHADHEEGLRKRLEARGLKVATIRSFYTPPP